MVGEWGGVGVGGISLELKLFYVFNMARSILQRLTEKSFGSASRPPEGEGQAVLEGAVCLLKDS